MLAAKFVPLMMVLSAAPGDPIPVSPSGQYRMNAGPDVASQLILHPDGRFEYNLSAGALDESSRGEWSVSGGALRLTTRPRPVPPSFSRLPASASGAQSFSIKVVSPDGSGIAGVDLELGFTDGSRIEAYTQDYGWSLAEDEARQPAWVQLSVPMHGLVSERFALDGNSGKIVIFQLTPNDLGIVDFSDLAIRFAADRIVIKRGEGEMVFIRTGAGRTR